LGAGLLALAVAFDVACLGSGLADGRAAFFAETTLWVVFFEVAFAGRLADLFGFFEGI
jgi:hypothetical protein